jgi:hypothetical protein
LPWKTPIGNLVLNTSIYPKKLREARKKMRKYKVYVFRRDRAKKENRKMRGEKGENEKERYKRRGSKISQKGSLCSLLFALLAIFGYHKAQEK